MSALDRTFAQAERVLLGSGHSDLAVMLSGRFVGQSFRVSVMSQNPISVGFALGKDDREKAKMMVLPSEYSNVEHIKRGDFVFVFDEGTKWAVLERELNPVTVTVDFVLKRETEKIQKIARIGRGGAQSGFFLANELGVFITDGNGNNIIV